MLLMKKDKLDVWKTHDNIYKIEHTTQCSSDAQCMTSAQILSNYSLTEYSSQVEDV